MKIRQYLFLLNQGAVLSVHHYITLHSILKAKEKRYKRNQYYFKIYRQMTLLSLTLVSPGAVKKNHLYDYIFDSGIELLESFLCSNSIEVVEKKIFYRRTGNEAIFFVNYPANKLKQLAIAFEDSTPMGRLWDLDIFDQEFRPISRVNLGYTPRKCLLCDDDAKICGRTQRHDISSLYIKIVELAKYHIFSNLIADIALDCLIKEAYLSPKPGLVDFENNGSHRDMDLTLLKKSAFAIYPFFKKFVQYGLDHADQPIQYLLSSLRALGVEAEKKMFKTTQGVNTHKGAIFSLGILCVASGILFYSRKLLTTSNICSLVQQMTIGITQELELELDGPSTSGKKAFKQHHLTGARGEVESGFLSVVTHSLPIYKQYITTLGHEHALLLAMLYLLSHNMDTNLFKRGGIQAIYWVQDLSKKILNDKKIFQHRSYLKERLREMNHSFVLKNLSPGGTADLLSVTLFFYRIEKLNVQPF